MIHVSGQHKTIGVPALPAITTMYPNAKVVTFNGNSIALLPHSFAEVRLLRSLGLDVPAPILSQYVWPHEMGKPPFEVQRRTCAMMTTNQRGYILNGMGTGKTNCALWSFDFLKSIGQAKRMLVVAPLSTLDFTWRRAVTANFGHLSATVLHGSKAKRLKLLAEDHDVYIINPHGLPTILPELLAREGLDTLTLDELAVFRNPKGVLNEAARDLSRKMVWAWGMTGSPTPNDPTDAYGQCCILTPNTVPTRASHFRDQVMTKIGPFKWVPKNGSKERVFEVMQPAVRFTLDDVIELPPVIERQVDVAMGKKQAEVYAKMKEHAYYAFQQDEVTAANAGAVLSKLLQISMGYVYAKKEGAIDREVMALDNDTRLQRLVDDINASSNKVIVFAPFTHSLQGIVDRLREDKHDVALVDGTVGGKERGRIFNLFQNTDKIRVLVAHPGSMAHGVTLTAADTIIWFGPTTSLETFEQANARIRRIGQKNKQLILMYQSTNAEKKMYSNLRAKQKVQDGVLAMFADAQL